MISHSIILIETYVQSLSGLGAIINEFFDVIVPK